jgi:adenine-specific DNA-methyltransferase
VAPISKAVTPRPPLLETVAYLSHGDQDADNRLVEGDNVAVLSALADELRGQVRCIYIDPPYNTSERWTHFDDRLSHEDWLTGIERSIDALWPCLSEDGSLWISIDDGEMHYLKVLVDRIVGRTSFVTTIVWEHRTTRENRRAFSNNHEYLLVYAKDPTRFKTTRNRVAATPDVLARYRNPDNDLRGPWQSVSANVQAGHATASQFYELQAPSGRRHAPPKGRCWVYTQERMEKLIANGEVWFGRDGNGVPRLKRFLATAQLEVTPETLWTADAVGTTMTAKRHLLSMFPDNAVFDTPKPEELVARILAIASDPGDLVLDAYLGSGTTTSVAHKMGRRWVGIERGPQAVTHCAERMRQVIDGEPGGISPAVDWCGGGGFAFLRAACLQPLAA